MAYFESRDGILISHLKYMFTKKVRMFTMLSFLLLSQTCKLPGGGGGGGEIQIDFLPQLFNKLKKRFT